MEKPECRMRIAPKAPHEDAALNAAPIAKDFLGGCAHSNASVS
jgi:hypothetical protein